MEQNTFPIQLQKIISSKALVEFTNIHVLTFCSQNASSVNICKSAKAEAYSMCYMVFFMFLS